MNLKAKMIVDTIRWSLERKEFRSILSIKVIVDAGAIFIKHDKGEGPMMSIIGLMTIMREKKLNFLILLQNQV